MKKMFCASAVFALVASWALSAQGTFANPTALQSGPDLSGRWNRDANASSGRAASEGWGPRIEIAQSGVNVTVQPSPGKPSRFRLDGKETAEVLSVDGCKNTVRITKAETSRDKVTITTWMVTKSVCVHGEDEDDPIVTHIGVVDVEKVFGRRKLESISDVYREGDTLTVQTTRSTLGETTTTSTTYRK
jgi:hypothetical protein